MTQFIVVLAILCSCIGCGVKTDPVPFYPREQEVKGKEGNYDTDKPAENPVRQNERDGK